LEQLIRNDERIERLVEVPGIGMLTASALVAAFDEPGRFDGNAKRAGSFLGLVPREHSSANKRRLGSISKSGPELVRRYLVHGARTCLRHKGQDPARRWAAKLESRIGTNKATVALAHKNARIAFALLRDGTRYGQYKGRAKKVQVAA